MFNFDYEYRDIFSFFILDDAGDRIPVARWNEFQNEYLTQLSILNELTDNGFAEFKSDTCEVEPIEILNLSEIEKRLLGLPDQYPYEIYIRSVGQLNQPDFKFNCGFYDFTPNGSRFNARRNGAVIEIKEIEEEKYLLSKNQFRICEAIEDFNSLPENERTFRHNLKCFAEIKSFSKEAAVLLDRYLESENPYYPDKIRIDLAFKDGTLEIIPTVDIENADGFVKAFDIYPKIQEVYPVQDHKGNRTRVIIDEKQKKGLEGVKSKRKITDKNEIAEIVEHPENFFDNESIDISIFYSERVKEIGIYKPKFYPFVSPYKSEWIPGIAIKDKIDGEKRIYFKNFVELHEFETEKLTAQRSGKESFEWKGSEIFIDDAEKFISIAKKQLENPKKPLHKRESLKEDEVLIIKENAELLEYVEESNQSMTIEQSFSAIENFNPSNRLKDHQVEGIAWLQSLFKKEYGGCLLADDMGLGKTLQLLYFIEWHSQTNRHSKPYLIIAPATLLENWEREYQRFFSPRNLSIITLYGKTIGLSKELDKEKVDWLQRKDIILTNYETLRIYQLTLCAVDYSVVVLDEAQRIKTPGTLITNVSKALKADFKIAITGTPVENTLVDLWSIFDFSLPGLLGNAKDFAKEYQNPLREEKTDMKEICERLRSKTGVFIMRRLKRDVAKDLPKKFDNADSKIERQMPKAQLERYKAEIEMIKNTESSGADKRNEILRAIWAIRDISDHPFLVDSQISDFKSDDLVSASAKLQSLLDILDQIKESNEKTIIFADRKHTQKMLQKVIFDYFGMLPIIINGDTPVRKKSNNKLSRQQSIDRFQEKEGFNVIIMSQLAAGIGLNVTEANHVVHYNRHWNPAKEEQATDRAYRIGQQRDVYVYYLMAVSEEFESFDLILDKLLERKKALSATVLFPTEQTEVRPDELFENIFAFDTEISKKALKMEDIDRLLPNLFEAYIAALYSKRGFDVHLTPLSNDKGADVVAMKDNQNYLFQVKQSKSKSLIGNGAVREIYTAKNYYDKTFKVEFDLCLISNSDFTHSAKILSKENNVKLINRLLLEEMNSKNDISIRDVNRYEVQRMKTI